MVLLNVNPPSINENLVSEIDVWRVPNYFWFHPETLEFTEFHLVDGKYDPLIPDTQRQFCDRKASTPINFLVDLN